MGDRLEQLNALTVTVNVASGAIKGHLANRNRIKISFADDEDYDEADVSALEALLSQLLTKLMAGRRQGFYSVVSQTEDEPVTEDDIPLTRQSREFRVARDSVEVMGESPDRRILIESIGMKEFAVKLDGDVISELECLEFTSMFARAFASLWTEYRMALKFIRDEVYSTKIVNSR